MGRKKKVVVETEAENLVDKILQNGSQVDEVLDGLVDGVKKEVEETETEVETPKFGSKEWNDYVLSHLVGDEIVDGAPTVDGLRRVAQLLVGPIISSKASSVNVSPEQTAVSYEIVVRWTYDDERLGNDIVFGGVADVTEVNADFPYNKYRAALAETRAEGRALKKMLGLKKTMTAEETNPQLSTNSKELITGAQIAVMQNLCNKMHINFGRFVEYFCGMNGLDVPVTIENMSKDNAQLACGLLNSFRADKSSEHYVAIPEQIKE